MYASLIMKRPPCLPFLLSLLLALCLAIPAQGTWSIVVSDSSTGEVGVGSATCLKNTDLKKGAGVIVVGKGAGQAQAYIDTSGVNRLTIFNGFLDGLTAQEVLAELQATDPDLQAHQYGLADIFGGSAKHTGTKAGKFKGGKIGVCGTIAYAITGNVLTGKGVLDAAEAALCQTEGDLGQKLMAAMQGAREYGGDGRCSCNMWDPTGCGCPPPSFQKSADVGYMVIARMGDTDGVCTKDLGCANGVYYMDLNVVTSTSSDPVETLQVLFDAFRGEWLGHADHLRSQKILSQDYLVADGASEALLQIALEDIDGSPILSGGASVTVSHDAQSAGASLIGPVVDHGDGTYSVILSAGTEAGCDLFRIEVDDGKGPVVLYPFPALDLLAPTFFAGATELSAIRGTPVPFQLEGLDGSAGREYLILGSASGTVPGFVYDGMAVHLNPDTFTQVLLYHSIGGTAFQGAFGTLDAAGCARAILDPEPYQLRPLIGKQLSFVWVTRFPEDFASSPVIVNVVP